MRTEFGTGVNAIHRDDQDMKVWTKRGKGSGVVYSTFDGWEIRGTGNQRRIFRPDGTPADGHVWPSLIAAKLRAVDYGADA